MTSINDEMSVHTPLRTKDVNVTRDVEPSPTYNHVQNNSTENTILKTSQEHENDPVFIHIESNKESSNNTIITQNEEDYKKILLSIISSLNKLDMTSNDNEPEAIEDSVVTMNDLPTESDLDIFSDSEDSLKTTKQFSTGFPDEPPSSDSSISSSSSSSSNLSISKKAINPSKGSEKKLNPEKSSSRLSDNKICSQALSMIKFLETLQNEEARFKA